MLTPTHEFLQQVVTTPAGYFELATKQSASVWKPYYYEWPHQIDEIVVHAMECKDDCDVYFSSHLFKSRDSHKDNALPSQTIQQDLDYADINTLPLTANLLVETSPNRHQGYWLVNDEMAPSQLDALSKRLAYTIPRCDRSGWPIGHKVRLPGTINHKYTTPHNVTILTTTSSIQSYRLEDLELLPDVELPAEQVDQDIIFVNDATLLAQPARHPTGPHELLESVKDKLTSKVYAEYASDVASTDRSASLYALTVQCFKAGLNREDVFWVAYHSANNKFRDLRYHGERELAKDVLRAETAVRSLSLNLRELINDVRRNTKLLVNERRRAIYDIVVLAMRSEGDFSATHDGRQYYTLRDQGQPMGIGEYSRSLNALLDLRYGLNKAEPEYSHVLNSLASYATTLPETAQVSILSHFDKRNNYIMIHTGRKLVYKVTPESVSHVVNGYNNVIFLWDRITEPFTPDLSTSLDWAAYLFGDIPNVINVSPEQAKILLKVWTIFALLRREANSRPILGLFGQPGSQKTTLARKLYALFYGRHTDISTVTNPQNFDIATATIPFYVLDNLDTWEKWLPDRLAQAAGNTDVIVRKLYSDAQIIRIKRQAMICITAHDPKFGRADVADRMLILSLLRFENMNPPVMFKDETSIIEGVLSNRNRLWGSIINDLQRVLATPFPSTTTLQLRIQDFARLGEWIALALGCHEVFCEVVNRIRDSQRTFSLDEESILVSTLQKWLSLTNCHPQPKSEAVLYQELLSVVMPGDQHQFMQAYRSSSHLSRRLSTLQSTLTQIMDIDWSTNKLGQRMWTIKCLAEEGTK